MMGSIIVGCLIGCGYCAAFHLLAGVMPGLVAICQGIATGLIPGAIMGCHVEHDL
jgi:hypothetical protein